MQEVYRAVGALHVRKAEERGRVCYRAGVLAPQVLSPDPAALHEQAEQVDIL